MHSYVLSGYSNNQKDINRRTAECLDCSSGQLYKELDRQECPHFDLAICIREYTHMIDWQH